MNDRERTKMTVVRSTGRQQLRVSGYGKDGVLLSSERGLGKGFDTMLRIMYKTLITSSDASTHFRPG